MSTDQIFAAQMWPWPDPMIKRDAQGHVLVINAAFLSIYGGSVENWTGQLINGWPAPQPAGQSTRFESRIANASGPDTVYDWMETTLPDGTALALARNVTNYVKEAVAPQTASAPAPMAESQPDPAPAQAQSVDSHAQDVAAPAAQITPEPAESGPAQAQAAQSAAAEILSDQVAMPSAAPAAAAAPALAPAPVSQDADLAVPQPSPEAEERAERDFQRRALPIEDGSAILGNNWRDAVIAKAVGAEGEADAANAGGDTATLTRPDAPQGSASEKVPASNIRILLAEDNAINALLTRTLLEAEGCQVDVVEDGALAVEAMGKNTYDMIFMDMRMPNMDGLEATRKIRAMGHTADKLPIVALTANAFDDDRNACFDSGMNDFMTKPVSAEELTQMVATHSGGGAKKIAS